MNWKDVTGDSAVADTCSWKEIGGGLWSSIMLSENMQSESRRILEPAVMAPF